MVFSHSDMELIDKSSKRKHWDVFTTKSKTNSRDRIEERCEEVLSICNTINLSRNDVSFSDLNKLYQIIQVFKVLNAKQKFGLYYLFL